MCAAPPRVLGSGLLHAPAALQSVPLRAGIPAALQALDADKKALKSHGRAAVRDIVQFVPLGKRRTEEVARELLAEIPRQVVGYFHDLKGLPPPPAWPVGAAGVPPGYAATHQPSPVM